MCQKSVTDFFWHSACLLLVSRWLFRGQRPVDVKPVLFSWLCWQKVACVATVNLWSFWGERWALASWEGHTEHTLTLALAQCAWSRFWFGLRFISGAWKVYCLSELYIYIANSSCPSLYPLSALTLTSCPYMSILYSLKLQNDSQNFRNGFSQFIHPENCV